MATKQKKTAVITKVIVKVVGPTIPADMKVGESVELHTGTYAKDPTSIQVRRPDGSEVGYIAARKQTAGGMPLASEIFPNVASGSIATVTSVNPLLIEVTLNEGAATNTEKVYWSTNSGTKYQCKNRMVLTTDTRKNGVCEVDVKNDGDQVSFYYKGELCGFASSNLTAAAQKSLAAKGIPVSSIEEIKEALANATSVKAEALFLDGINIPVKITVTSDSAATPVVVTEDLSKSLKGFSEEDKAEMEKRINWLKNTPKLAPYAVKLYIKDMQGKENLVPFAPSYIPTDKEVEIFVKHHAINGNSMLIGPAGCGKNEFLKVMANLYSDDMVDMSCSPSTEYADIIGYLGLDTDDQGPDASEINAQVSSLMQIITKHGVQPKEFVALPVEEQVETAEAAIATAEFDKVDFSMILDAMRSKNAKVKFILSPIMKAIMSGSIVNFDEVNTLRSTVTAALHSLLDKRRYIFVPEYGRIDVHPDTRFTSTMNEGADYVGTAMMNQAFEDRWRVIEFQAPEGISDILKQEVPTCPAKAIKVLNELYKKLKPVRGIEIQERSFSQRAFIYAAESIAMGDDIKNAIYSDILPKIRDVDDREAVKGIVDLML